MTDSELKLLIATNDRAIQALNRVVFNTAKNVAQSSRNVVKISSII